MLVRDWNAWRPAREASVAPAPVELELLNHPEYLLKSSKGAFDRSNASGMRIEVTHRKLSLVYEHVGSADVTPALRKLALDTLARGSPSVAETVFGAVVQEVQPGDSDDSVTYHRRTREHLAQWMVEGFEDHLRALAAGRTPRVRRPIHGKAWELFLTKAEEAEARVGRGDAESSYRRLKRLLVAMRFPRDVVEAMQAAEDVVPVAPFFGASDLRARRDGRGSDARVADDAQRRWPGYPVLGYAHALQHVRDFSLGLQTDGDAAHVLRHVSVGHVFSAFHKSTFAERIPLEIARGQKRFARAPPSEWSSRVVADWNALMRSEVGAPTLDTSDDDLVYPVFLVLRVGEEGHDALLDAFVKKKHVQSGHAHHTLTTALREQIAALVADASAHQWVVALLPSYGKARAHVTLVLLSQANIHLQRPLAHVQERLELGMPWDFAQHTSVRPRPKVLHNPVRVYELTEVEPSTAIEALRRLFVAQAEEYANDDLDGIRAHNMRRVLTQEKTLLDAFPRLGPSTSVGQVMETLLARVKRAAGKTGLGGSVLEYVLQFHERIADETKVFAGVRRTFGSGAKMFTFWPTAADRFDYHIVESREPDGPAYDVLHLDDIWEDAWVSALFQVCKRRSEQRSMRDALLEEKRSPLKYARPKDAETPASPLPRSDQFSRGMYLYIRTVPHMRNTRDVIVDAFTARSLPKNLEFNMYERVGAVDESRPGNVKVRHKSLRNIRDVASVLPRHVIKSKDGRTRAYGATKHSTFDGARKGFGAFDDGELRVCMLFDGKVWLPAGAQSAEVRVVKKTTARSDRPYQLLFFVSDADSRTKWHIGLSDLRNEFGIPVIGRLNGVSN